MKKQTKLLLALAAVGVAGYLWSKSQKRNATGKPARAYIPKWLIYGYSQNQTQEEKDRNRAAGLPFWAGPNYPDAQ